MEDVQKVLDKWPRKLMSQDESEDLQGSHASCPVSPETRKPINSDQRKFERTDNGQIHHVWEQKWWHTGMKYGMENMETRSRLDMQHN